jgi:hypothetical protein
MQNATGPLEPFAVVKLIVVASGNQAISLQAFR